MRADEYCEYCRRRGECGNGKCGLDCPLIIKKEDDSMSKIKKELQKLFLFQREAFFSNHELYGDDWEKKEEMITLTEEAISAMIRVINATGTDYSELEKTLQLSKVEQQNMMFMSLGLMRSQLAEHHKRAYYIVYATISEVGY